MPWLKKGALDPKGSRIPSLRTKRRMKLLTLWLRAGLPLRLCSDIGNKEVVDVPPHLSWNLSSLHPHAPLLTRPHPCTSALGPRRLQIPPVGAEEPPQQHPTNLERTSFSYRRTVWQKEGFFFFFLCDYAKAWYVFKVLWMLHCLAPAPEDETGALLLLLSVTGQTCSRALKTQGQCWAPLKLWGSEYCWRLLNSWKQEFSVNLARKCWKSESLNGKATANLSQNEGCISSISGEKAPSAFMPVPPFSPLIKGQFHFSHFWAVGILLSYSISLGWKTALKYVSWQLLRRWHMATDFFVRVFVNKDRKDRKSLEQC